MQQGVINIILNWSQYDF